MKQCTKSLKSRPYGAVEIGLSLGCHCEMCVTANLLLLLAPLGVLDPQEQKSFNRRDSSPCGGMPRTTSEGSSGTSVSSPVTPQVPGTLSVYFFSFTFSNKLHYSVVSQQQAMPRCLIHMLLIFLCFYYDCRLEVKCLRTEAEMYKAILMYVLGRLRLTGH